VNQTVQPPIDDEQDELEFANTPNFLTLFRILMVPIVVGLLFLKNPTWDFVAAWIFVAASITDYFDGAIARAQNIVTVYGKLLDPLADKFLVVSILIMLQHLERIHPVVVILLICRELAITGLRALASAEGFVIPASNSAKWKTATQMVALPLIMAKEDWLGIPMYATGMTLLYISLLISLWSAKDYVVNFFKKAKEARDIRREKKRMKREEKRKLKS
tara:strand:+ start:4336 stop:4989 length:654 start_codon:yes stop_codon:yes gene_type:complete